MRKRYRYHGIRSPRTTQERRLASVEPHLVRGKRHACNLPHVYDDIWVDFSFSWKEMRKHQYREKKSQYHTVFIAGRGNSYLLYNHFIQKNCYFNFHYTNEGLEIEWWE